MLLPFQRPANCNDEQIQSYNCFWFTFSLNCQFIGKLNFSLYSTLSSIRYFETIVLFPWKIRELLYFEFHSSSTETLEFVFSSTEVLGELSNANVLLRYTLSMVMVYKLFHMRKLMLPGAWSWYLWPQKFHKWFVLSFTYEELAPRSMKILRASFWHSSWSNSLANFHISDWKHLSLWL